MIGWEWLLPLLFLWTVCGLWEVWMVSLRGTFLRRRFLCGDGVNGLGVGVNRRLVWRSEWLGCSYGKSGRLCVCHPESMIWGVDCVFVILNSFQDLLWEPRGKKNSEMNPEWHYLMFWKTIFFLMIWIFCLLPFHRKRPKQGLLPKKGMSNPKIN